jgi:hypothetical protein
MLLQRGPACVASDRHGHVVGYALSKMAIPGVLEVTNLALDASASSGETEMEMLTHLHQRGRTYNVDIAMLYGVRSSPPYTPTFAPVLKELGYIPRVSIGADNSIPILARALWHLDAARRMTLRRFDPSQEHDVGQHVDHALGFVRDPIDDPGEVDGRLAPQFGFGAADTLQLSDLTDPRNVAICTQCRVPHPRARRAPVRFRTGMVVTPAARARYCLVVDLNA